MYEYNKRAYITELQNDLKGIPYIIPRLIVTIITLVIYLFHRALQNGDK